MNLFGLLWGAIWGFPPDFLEEVFFPFEEKWMLEDVFWLFVFLFVEVVHIKLPNEGGEVGMLEKSRQDDFWEVFLFFDAERVPVGSPAHDVVKEWVLQI